ncbi:MAG: hypothetical protein Crog4KO_14470 [Crocinitomicaceae bacterium]
MKYLAFTLLLTGTFLFTACGWTENQREAARKSIGDGFTEGLESSGATVDPKVKEAWLDCVMEKATEKWTFDELTEAPSGLDAIQDKCAKEVGLYDAITVE